MSDKPNIYGFCKAGCQWETVHKEDFLKSASIIEVAALDGGIYALDATQPQTYRIVSERDPLGASAYAAGVMLQVDDDNLLGATIATIPIKEFDEYRNFFELEILSFSSTATEMVFVYEINGNRYKETVTGGTAIDGTTARLVITGANAVYLFNRYATIEAKIDKSDIEAAITTALNTEV